MLFLLILFYKNFDMFFLITTFAGEQKKSVSNIFKNREKIKINAKNNLAKLFKMVQLGLKQK